MKMDDRGIGGLEARGAPPQLQFDAVKPSQLARTVSAPPRGISAPAPTMEPKSGTGGAGKWNTKNLALRLGADLVSASAAAGLVAPIISIIDR